MLPRITDVVIQDFRSIAYCSLHLHDLNILIGKNGAGKSNIIDAISFVSEVIRGGLVEAIKARNGFDQIRRKTAMGMLNPKFWIRVRDEGKIHAQYSLHLEPDNLHGFRVKYEAVHYKLPNEPLKSVHRERDGTRASGFRVVGRMGSSGLVLDSLDSHDPSNLLRYVFGRFFVLAPNPEKMRLPWPSRVSLNLDADAHNIASYLLSIYRTAPEVFRRVERFLAATGAPVTAIDQTVSVGGYDVFSYRKIDEVGKSISLSGSTLSDGSLRMIAIAAAVLGNRSDLSVELVDRASSPFIPCMAIEEPETSLHPTAIAALVDLLVEGSQSTQLIVTCHSPEVLDHKAIRPEMITVVESTPAGTFAGPIGAKPFAAIQSHLVSAADLSRQGMLVRDPATNSVPSFDSLADSPWPLEELESQDD